MCFTPIAWRYSFPHAESPAERIWILEAEQICGLVQLEDGVGEIIPCHLVAGLIEYTLKTVTRVLQAALQDLSRSHSAVARSARNSWREESEERAMLAICTSSEYPRITRGSSTADVLFPAQLGSSNESLPKIC